MNARVWSHEVAQVIARLDDGTQVSLRPIGPEDRQRLADGWTRLSPQSQYRRFFVSRPRLSEQILRYLTEIDQQQHVAWGAMAPNLEGQPGLGVGRFVCLDGRPAVAEMALTVVDGHQRQGLGSLLLAILYRQALLQGVRVLRSVLLPDHPFLPQWLERLGATVRDRFDVLDVDLPVYGDLGRLPGNPSAGRFRELLAALDSAVPV